MCSTGRNGEGNLAQGTKLGKYTVKGYTLCEYMAENFL